MDRKSRIHYSVFFNIKLQIIWRVIDSVGLGCHRFGFRILKHCQKISLQKIKISLKHQEENNKGLDFQRNHKNLSDSSRNLQYHDEFLRILSNFTSSKNLKMTWILKNSELLFYNIKLLFQVNSEANCFIGFSYQMKQYN